MRIAAFARAAAGDVTTGLHLDCEISRLPTDAMRLRCSALTTLKYEDERFENASVEFDERRMAPTYRLLWGVPGRSNALNIAARLGLDDDVVEAARERLGASQVLFHGQALCYKKIFMPSEAPEGFGVVCHRARQTLAIQTCTSIQSTARTRRLMRSLMYHF